MTKSSSTHVVLGESFRSRARAYPGVASVAEHQQADQRRGQARVAAAEEAMRAAGFKGQNKTEENAIGTVANLGQTCERLLTIPDRLERAEGNRLMVVMIEEEAGQLRENRAHIIEVLKRLGWKTPELNDAELVKSCRAAWASWTAAKATT